jgi:acyl-coenzyme A synthetase/AMP-(fatty) acid ligase
MYPDFARSFLRHARRSPAAPALFCSAERPVDGAVSYGSLAALAEAAQAPLRVLPPGPVAVTGPKSPGVIAAILACLADARPVLLPPAGLSPAALAGLCERAAAVGTLDGGGRVTAFGPAAGTAGGGGRVTSRGPADPLLADACFVLTTSGSTGTPKLVPLPASGVDRFVSWAARQFSIEPGTVVLNYAPLNFDLCLLDIWATLARGGCAVLVDPGRAAWPGYLSGLVAVAGPAVVQGVPMLYQVLSEAGSRVASARHVILTGDHAPPALTSRLPDLFPAARCYNVYGCTETNDSFLHEFDPREVGGLAALPIGQPLPGAHAQVSDDGELLVRTPFQARGYLGGDAAGRFAGAWYRTGDLVRREDGLLYLAGRNDFQVKVRGTRVNLQQVEQALTGAAGVLEAAAVAVRGGDGTRIHLVVRGHGLTPLTARALCAERLPTAMIPASIQVVTAPLPRTGTGKVDRNQILRKIERTPG